jgi:hypothetical protein
LSPIAVERTERTLAKRLRCSSDRGMVKTDDTHPNGIVFIYVGTCDWENSFEYCVKEFVLTVFHEIMHILCPDIDEYVPYAEKLLAEILENPS